MGERGRRQSMEGSLEEGLVNFYQPVTSQGKIAQAQAPHGAESLSPDIQPLPVRAARAPPGTLAAHSGPLRLGRIQQPPEHPAGTGVH